MNYFVPISGPQDGGHVGSGEWSEYNRRPTCFFWRTNQITWKWTFSEGTVLAAPLAIRMMLDGVPVTDYVQAVNGSYTFNATIPNGHHLPTFETLTGAFPADILVLEKGITVNSGNTPLPVQNPWTSTTRFELSFSRLAYGTSRVPNADLAKAPKVVPQKARSVAPYSTRVPRDQLWNRNIHLHTNIAMQRRITALPSGDLSIEADQEYFVFDAYNPKVGVRPYNTLRDGPRGQSTLGFLYTMIPSPESTGWYFSDVVGRIGHIRTSDGNVTTLAGWRNKKPKANGGLRNSNNAADRAFYNDCYEIVGDWSQVPGVKQFLELWGLESLPDPRHTGLHEFWAADTLNHRILYLNHYSAHAHGDGLPPLYAPADYVDPGITGKTSLAVYLSKDKLAAQGYTQAQIDDLMNEPWGIKHRAQDNKLYWTCFAAGTICRANLDGTGAEVVFKTAVNPTDAMLGIPAGQRLVGSGNATPQQRSLYHADGGPGVYKGCRPQSLDIDSDGNLVWGERYVYAIRRGNPDTRIVETIVLLPVSYASFGLADINLVVDRNAWIGPKDDVIVVCWHNSSFRYAKDGTSIGNPFYNGDASYLGVTGPVPEATYCEYTWGLGIDKGRLINEGSGGGSFITEHTPRLPTDTVMNGPLYRQGIVAVRERGVPPFSMLHGPHLQGELGYANFIEMGGWDDATIKSYLAAHGLTSTSDQNGVLHFIRHETQGLDYALSPPVPVDCVLSEWSAWIPTSDWGACVDGIQSRTEQRTRTVVTQPTPGGAACGDLSETRVMSQPCTPPTAPCEELLAECRALNVTLQGKIDAALEVLK
jgi:hypothetical protein